MKAFNQLPTDLQNESVYKYHQILFLKKNELKIKFVFDKLLSIFLLILFLPIFIFFAIWIKIDSQGPVFYRQLRITQYGKQFYIFKFRTMVSNADKIGGLVTVDGDSRITKVGQVIRKYRIDEIPQLINVLRGEMSFVGIRPEVERYVLQYTDEMKATLLLPAGITSPASIMFRAEDALMNEHIAKGMTLDEAYIQKVLPEKMQHNLKYIENFSFLYDLKIIFETAIKVFK